MRLACGFLVWVVLVSSAPLALAEGSAEFDLGDVSGTHNPHDQAVSTTTELRVDIADGASEKLCWKGTGAIAVYEPSSGPVVSASLASASCVDAIAGVNGAYGITLLANQVMGVEWDVRVCDQSVVDSDCLNTTTYEQPGRVWSYRWDFSQNNSYNISFSVNGSVYAIVPGGAVGRDAVIEMQMRGVSGAVYKLFANNLGPETTAGVRIGRSTTRTGNKVTPVYPLYLNPPSIALYNWLPPTISNVTLAPSCGTGVVLGAAAGAISFTTNVTGQYVVVCDVNKDGAYNFAGLSDFSSFGNAAVGANTVTWSGNSNAGSPAAPGVYQCIVRVNVGEFHYVAEDIETSFPGIRMYRVEADKTARTAIDMFWDDTGVSADNENMPVPVSLLSPVSPVSTGLAPGAYGTAADAFHNLANNPASPTGNARAWGNFDADGKGNNNYLDQFSAADTALSPPFDISVFANSGDEDADGLTNARECAIGTDPEDADTDGDGVDDGYEASNASAPNTDGDAFIDALDTDDDADGVLTSIELGAHDGDGDPADAANSDATGQPDYLDLDSDGDGVCDGPSALMGTCAAGPDIARTDPLSCRDTDADNCDDCANTAGNGSGGSPSNDGTDTDSDGTCNLTDDDDDDDGVCDDASAVGGVCDAGPDSAPLDDHACSDTDGDGCDDCSAGSGSQPASDGADADGDGQCDAGDADDDDDGVCDGALSVANVCVAGPDSAPLDDHACSDTDGDGCEDCLSGLYDPNADGVDVNANGLCDTSEDNDGDGAPDSTDLDDDNDGILDTVEELAGGADADGDGIPNRFDLDADNDGIADLFESGAFDTDTDGDGMVDGPFGANGFADDLETAVDSGSTTLRRIDTDGDGDDDFLDLDSDGDGLTDIAEVAALAVFDADDDGRIDNTSDADDDGLMNPVDQDRGTFGFPKSITDPRADDEDGDGIPAAYDADEEGSGSGDSDGDGASDDAECASGWPCPDGDDDHQPNYMTGDDDGDGIANEDDLDDDNDGILDAQEDRADSDGDAIENRLDLDSDGDGLSDLDESGHLSRKARDENRDGRVDGAAGENGAPNTAENGAADSGSVTAPRDTDGDRRPDFLDADADGDGVLDQDEAGDANPKTLPQDSDGDGTPNYVDLDDDGDRLTTKAERTEEAALGGDVDGDGTPAHLDTDADGDGRSDEDERDGDTDGDGVPNYLDPQGPAPVDGDTDGDTDGDGLQDTQECPTTPCRDSDDDGQADYLDDDDDDDSIPTKDERPDGMSTDSDGDGTADFLDTDDDGDSVPTIDERPNDQDLDTNDDGTPDHLDIDDDGDGIPTKDERPGDISVDTDGDGIPDFRDLDDDGDGIPTKDEPSDADHDGIPDRLEPPREGTLAGGALCAVAAPGSAQTQGKLTGAWMLALAGIAMRLRRRPRAGSPKKVRSAAMHAARLLSLSLALLAAAGMTRVAHAQVALDQLKPSPLASDGFALSRPEGLGHLKWGALLMLDYANDPLVYELTSPTREIAVVQDHLVAHVGAALGIADRLTVFAMIPINVVMSGETPAGLAPAADGAGLGDLTVGGRAILVGAARSALGVSAELIARLPTAGLANGAQVYSGDEIGSYEPALVAELRLGRLDFRIRPGVRLREQRRVGNLELGPELVYGAGARLLIVRGLYAHAELFGASTFASFGKREQTPLELLFGGKYGSNDWFVGAAAGPGLAQGYGAPNARVIASIGYAPVQRPAPPPGPRDTDGDGLLDPDDACPAEPEDRDAFEDLEGCPDPDNDKDGVLDVNDSCVMEPEDKDAFEDDNGCPDPDNDKDGILDADDQCVMEPEDKDAFEDDNGCPDPDNDKDGVLDVDDQCPQTPGVAETKGCPKSVRLDLDTGRIMILDRVEFAINADVILEASAPILDEVEKTLTANPPLKRVRIEGHTDDVGRDTKNMDLSQRRARSVARWLTAHGVDAARMEAFGCGENRPLMEGKDKSVRQQNRRVEFHITDPAPPQPRSTDGCKGIALE